MRLNATPTVALILPTNLYYAREVLLGVFQYLRTHRPWTLITGDVGNPGWSFPPGTKLPAVLGMLSDGPFLKRMKRAGIPCINVSERWQNIGTARVLPDNLAAGQQAAEYFLGKKFRHFAFTGCDDFGFSKLRHQGFEEVLRAAGYDCFSLQFGSGKWPRDSMDPLPEIGEWLETLPRPCAIFTHADDHARRVLNECRRLKINVPEEIAVLGCDNDEIECELSPTPISSVAFPLRHLGYEAASTVELLLSGSEPEQTTQRLAPSGIITRRSTDIIALHDPILARAVSFISAHASEPIDVSDVVRASGCSRRYLERRFKTLLGRTPKQEILRVRVCIAKRILSETHLQMPEVANAAGFSDSKMLSAVFARDVGMTPSDYRRSVRTTDPLKKRKSPRRPSPGLNQSILS